MIMMTMVTIIMIMMTMVTIIIIIMMTMVTIIMIMMTPHGGCAAEAAIEGVTEFGVKGGSSGALKGCGCS